MPFDYNIVNAFTTSAGPHSGNQAAVVILPPPSPTSPTDEWRAPVARDFGFSETAYVEPLSPGRWTLRWFTPEIEVQLCGHATLAASAVLFEREPDLTTLTFETRFSGELRAKKVAQGIEISLPTIKQEHLDQLEDQSVAEQHKQEVTPALQAAVPELRAVQVERVFKWPWGGGDSCIVQVSSDVPLKELKVEPKHMLGVSTGMNIVTQVAPSSDSHLHINSRVFVPGAGVDEDPVTGSAHAYLAGYFTSPSIRSALPADPSVIHGEQLSTRGGTLVCKRDGDMVKITGKASIWASGTLQA